jgi:hypothetical protein
MWLFTNIGFFRIVQKSGNDFITIRARVASDLDSLRKKFMPGLSPRQPKAVPISPKLSLHPRAGEIDVFEDDPGDSSRLGEESFIRLPTLNYGR